MLTELQYEQLIADYDINVMFMQLPPHIYALTVYRDGRHLVLISSTLSQAEQRKAFEHEVSHIIHDDFHSDKTADEIEKERHKI